MSESNLQLCVGIDPQFDVVDDFFRKQLTQFGSRSFLLKYCEAIISAVADRTNTVKFQSAFFEARGHEGLHALQDAIVQAKSHGLQVILDAKRGDIGTTMAAYGEFAFKYLNADSLTVNPFVGNSCVLGLENWLKQGRSCFLVLLTSSGSGDVFQEEVRRQLESSDSAMSAYLEEFERLPYRSQIGIVVGAQRVDALSPKLFERLRKFRWLVPGIGAQGGTLSNRLREPSEYQTLIAVSRELSGDLGQIGLGKQADITSWRDFEEFVSENVAKFATNLDP